MYKVVKLFSLLSVLAIASTQLPSAFAQGCGGGMFGSGKPGNGPKFAKNFNGNGRGCWWKNQMNQTGANGAYAPWQQQYQGAYGAPLQQQYQGTYGSPYQGAYGSAGLQNVFGSLIQPNGYQNIFQQQGTSPQMLAWRQQLLQQFDLNRDGRLDKSEKSQLRQYVRNLINAQRSGQGLLTSTPQISPYAPYMANQYLGNQYSGNQYLGNQYSGNQYGTIGGFRSKRGRI